MPSRLLMEHKVLVVAGTHQRETGFSHPTADIIISEMGGSPTKPGEELVGIDEARKAELWDFGKLAVAKIHKIGEPCRKYLDTLPFERLFYLARHRAYNANSEAEFAETFENTRQWTSVHWPLLDMINPMFFLDLHSFHKYTEGISGTGAYMSIHTDKHGKLVSDALTRAQAEEPGVYGMPGKPFPLEDIDALRERIASRTFTEDEMLEMLSIPQEGIYSSEAFSSFSRKVRDIDAIADDGDPHNWGNQWYINPERGETGDYANVCLEAVHWGRENQEATARFITKYLASLL